MAEDTSGRDLSRPQGDQPRSESGASVPEAGPAVPAAKPATPAKRVPPRTSTSPTTRDSSQGSASGDGEEQDGFLKSLFAPVAGFGVTFSTMFRKIQTEEYPEEKRPTEARFHGRHQLNVRQRVPERGVEADSFGYGRGRGWPGARHAVPA